MPSTNKKYFDIRLKEKAWNKFLGAIKKSKSSKELIASIKKFLTDSEIILLEKRLAISVLLEDKKSYRDIGQSLDVTRTTISFVKHNLTRKPRKYRKYSSGPDKKRKKLPIMPPYVGYGRWLRAKTRGQDYY